jgi:hypothetical protein
MGTLSLEGVPFLVPLRGKTKAFELVKVRVIAKKLTSLSPFGYVCYEAS